jgi:hypothetical protein
MDLIELKNRFDRKIAACASSLSAAQAWEIYRELLFEEPDGEWADEWSCNAGAANRPAAGKIADDPTRYQIYLGRLTDIRTRGASRTLEINLYFRFDLTPCLKSLLTEKGEVAVEDAWNSNLDAETISNKRAEFIHRVEEQASLLGEVWEQSPTLTDLQVQLW